jgi:hypothetical protein
MTLAINDSLTWRASLVLINENGEFQILIDSSYSNHYLTPDAATVSLLQRSAVEIQKVWETKVYEASSVVETPISPLRSSEAGD